MEHNDELPFADTPLHIAASTGQIPFAVETMGLKPSFAWKLDPNGFSPIHLALQNGHIEMVRRLLQLDGDLVRVKGRERLIPLHYVVESGEHGFQNQTRPEGRIVKTRNWDENRFFKPKEPDFLLIL